MEGGGWKREVGGGMGPSSLWAAGVCAHCHSWLCWGACHCPWVGGCGHSCVIMGVRCCGHLSACWDVVGCSSPWMGCAMGARSCLCPCWCGCGVSHGVHIVAGTHHLWAVVGLLSSAVEACGGVVVVIVVVHRGCILCSLFHGCCGIGHHLC